MSSMSCAAFRGAKAVFRSGLAGLVLFSAVAFLPAQETSVRPKINEVFENPDVVAFAARFEREGRDESARGGWKELFNGKTIDDGWKVRGGFAKYKVEEGAIVGTTSEGSPNTFLCKGPFGDFELQFEVLCDKELNSGVQIRSHVAEKDMPNPSGKGTIRKGTVYGYQCEIAPGTKTSGNFWDEARHGKWWDELAGKPGAEAAYKVGEWNRYRIVAQGDHIRSWINDVPCADFHEKTDASGVIGLQVHGIGKGKGPYQVRWRKIRLRELKPEEKVE